MDSTGACAAGLTSMLPSMLAHYFIDAAVEKPKTFIREQYMLPKVSYLLGAMRLNTLDTVSTSDLRGSLYALIESRSIKTAIFIES